MIPTMTGVDGEAVRRAFAFAARNLNEYAGAIDAINEYPVPDGDTGSNMSATLDRAVQDLYPLDPVTIPAVLQALARGALYGARGNSGVILSQALKGLAAGVGDVDRLDAKSAAAGIVAAAEAAYRAVSKPSEGTMLTVLRVAGEKAAEVANSFPDGGAGAPAFEVLARATQAAEEAEAETINQLPELQAAGVPDAGGEGICVILRGIVAAFSGVEPRAPNLPLREIATQSGHGASEFGFCTEFLLEQAEAPIDVEALRALALSMGSASVVVVGDETLARLHAHTESPQELVERAGGMGKVSRLKVEDMSAQNARLRSTGSGAGKRSALLALVNGEGFEDLFASLDAATAPLGEIVKPSAGDIAAAADALNAPDVIVLPNHRNVILAAEQAKDIARCTIHVLPVTSIPQGIAAALAYDADVLPSANVTAMSGAYGDIATIEVTVAQSDRTADGIAVKAGRAIALLDGTLVAAEADPVAALLAGLVVANADEASLISVYTGEGVSGDAETLGIAERFEDAEIEVFPGGQPLYQFIASVER